jgi:hypothetical protein
MGKLYTRKDIESLFNWEEIEKETELNKTENYEGEIEGFCFIGTVFSLAPSGKYYMPFACSNVDICPKCKGKGSIKNPFYNERSFQRALENDRFYRFEAIRLFGGFINGNWPKQWQEIIKKAENTYRFFEEMKTCKYCNGLGSREAFEDEIFFELLEEIASEKGLFVTSNEGNPTDILIGKSFDREEIENG